MNNTYGKIPHAAGKIKSHNRRRSISVSTIVPESDFDGAYSSLSFTGKKPTLHGVSPSKSPTSVFPKFIRSSLSNFISRSTTGINVGNIETSKASVLRLLKAISENFKHIDRDKFVLRDDGDLYIN